MFTAVGLFLMFTVFLFIFAPSLSIEVFTEKSVTAVRGRNISIPCSFSGDTVPAAVYWYRHNYTNAPDNIATLVVQEFQGRDLRPGGNRYNITADYRLVIINVSVSDETTYSCQVVLPFGDNDRGYTDVRVVAFAEPLHPVIVSCKLKNPGQCTYTLARDIPEQTKLVCKLQNVRPRANLTWKSHDGIVQKAADTRIKEDGGLFDIFSDLQVYKYDYDSPFTCEANGEAVRGTSSMTVTIMRTKGRAAFIVPIVILLLVIITVIAVVFVRKRFPFVCKKNEDKPEDDAQDQPLNPTETKIAELRKIIENYVPGGLTDAVVKDGRKLPDRIRIAVVGATAAGKSSLIRSLKYAYSGKYSEEIEIHRTVFGGAVTITSTFYKITDSIHIQDNQGLRDLDAKHVEGIMQEVEKERICLLIPVFRVDGQTRVQEIRDIFRQFTEKIRAGFASYPLVILTHRDKAGDDKERKNVRDMVVAMGALDENVKLVENLTKKPADESECQEVIIEFLELLVSMLTMADKNLIHQLNKGISFSLNIEEIRIEPSPKTFIPKVFNFGGRKK